MRWCCEFFVLTSLAQATLKYTWKSIPFHSQAFMNGPRSRDQWLDWALIVGEFPGDMFFFEMLGWGMRATQDKDKEKAISFSLFFKTHLSCADMKLYCSAAGYGFSMYMFYFFPFFHLITRVLRQRVPSYQGEFFGNCRFYWRLPSKMTNLVILKVEGTTVLLLLT